MDGKYLFYREDLKLSAAVGKFHLETHILECFWEFTWKAPASLMAKSLRHCGPLSIKSLGAQEACHVHIARSGNLVISKMDRAQDGLVSVQEAFEQLSARVGDSVIAKWKEEETQALAHGGVGRKIYKAEAVESPGIAETCLRLTEAEKKARGGIIWQSMWHLSADEPLPHRRGTQLSNGITCRREFRNFNESNAFFYPKAYHRRER
ncbi:hypothetical protein B0H13DRAFT_1887142 [Mycena leptocephala]|nr:hypothetical protein B0H13DRAFT_1887142 [Mycena leptocephala]